MENKLTYRQIAEETVEFYSQDVSLRALVADKCTYYDPETQKCCAVGRYMKHPESFTLEDVGETGFDLILGNHPFNQIMKEEVHDCNDLEFWFDLQRLHDKNSYWKGFGLSEDGKEAYHDILELADKLDAKK